MAHYVETPKGFRSRKREQGLLLDGEQLEGDSSDNPASAFDEKTSGGHVTSSAFSKYAGPELVRVDTTPLPGVLPLYLTPFVLTLPHQSTPLKQHGPW